MAYGLKDVGNWWDLVNESQEWQNRIFQVLAVLYGVVAAVALVQLVRIQPRVPEYGWTTQKVFHFLNFLVNGVRSVVFVFRRDVQTLQPEIVRHMLLDVPSLAFFTTYALLVLFWAEIYYQARAVSTDGFRPSFLTINGVVYAIQVYLLLGLGAARARQAETDILHTRRGTRRWKARSGAGSARGQRPESYLHRWRGARQKKAWTGAGRAGRRTQFSYCVSEKDIVGTKVII